MRKNMQFSARHYLIVILGSLVFAAIGIATVSSMDISQTEQDDLQFLSLNGDSDDAYRDGRGYPPPWATKTPRGSRPTPTSDPDP